MEVSIRTFATLATGKWFKPDSDEFWSVCNFVTQSNMSNLCLFSRGASFVGSCLAEQFPELSAEDCSSVKDEETCNTFIAYLEEKYGAYVKVSPSDRPFLELEPLEEWANAKGISMEEAEASAIIIKK